MSYSRRGFLTAASVGVGAVAASAVSAPMAAANPFGTGSLGAISQKFLEAVPAARGLIQPNGTLGYVGATFPSFDDIAGQIRFGFPDGSLGDWIDLQPHDSQPDVPGEAGTELVAAPEGATTYEVNATEGARVTSFDDGRAGRQEDYSLGNLLLGLPVISRAQWGAGDVPGFRWSPQFHAAQGITIHHTAVPVGADRAAGVRSIYNYHANTLGWGDVGYHLLIDPEGRIYQGRGGTPAGNPIFQVPPVGGIAPPVVTAGHVGGNNDGNIGISLLGDFTHQPPTPAAVGATIDAVRALSGAIGLNPHAGITYRGRGIHGVSGHRDWGGTACPGDSFYPQMQFIRDIAAQGWIPTGSSI